MKKIFCTIIILVSGFQIQAQLLNPKFEDWNLVKVFPDGDSLWSPQNWTVYNICNDNNYYGDKMSKMYKIEGKFSIGLFSIGCGITGDAKTTYLVYGNHDKKSINKPKSWGVPYANNLKILGGKYNFINEGNIKDSGYAQVILRKYNFNKSKSDTIGFGNITFPISAKKNILLPFEIKINYPDASVVPDTMILIFQSSKALLNTTSKSGNGLLILDSLYLSEDLLSIESENASSAALTVYPNPTNITLGIKTSLNIAKLIVYQSNGTKALESKATDNLDVSMLPEGLYLLEVWDMEGRRVVKKFEKR